jgi:hypothetical protein
MAHLQRKCANPSLWSHLAQAEIKQIGMALPESQYTFQKNQGSCGIITTISNELELRDVPHQR